MSLWNIFIFQSEKVIIGLPRTITILTATVDQTRKENREVKLYVMRKRLK
jgi:hypothetical protein